MSERRIFLRHCPAYVPNSNAGSSPSLLVIGGKHFLNSNRIARLCVTLDKRCSEGDGSETYESASLRPTRNTLRAESQPFKRFVASSLRTMLATMYESPST